MIIQVLVTPQIRQAERGLVAETERKKQPEKFLHIIVPIFRTGNRTIVRIRKVTVPKVQKILPEKER